MYMIRLTTTGQGNRPPEAGPGRPRPNGCARYVAEQRPPSLSLDDAAPDPPLRAGLVDEEVEAVAVRVAARTFEVANANCVQALVWVRPARFHNPDTPRV